MIYVRVIDGAKYSKQEFWVKNPKKIEWYEKMAEHNPEFVRILKVVKNGSL